VLVLPAYAREKMLHSVACRGFGQIVDVLDCRPVITPAICLRRGTSRGGSKQDTRDCHDACFLHLP
jgi:hypothetical protein